jgi:uncharacterized membrane protein YkvI
MLDTILKLAGLLISVVMAVTAGRSKRLFSAVCAIAIVLIMFTFVCTQRMHQQDIEATQKAMMDKLSSSPWNFDQIYSELQYTSYMVAQEALFDAVSRGIIKSKQAECGAFNDGTILPMKVYYIEQRK